MLMLVCQVCKSQNYVSEKNKLNDPAKLVFNKYCHKCRKTTAHKESGKFK